MVLTVAREEPEAAGGLLNRAGTAAVNLTPRGPPSPLSVPTAVPEAGVRGGLTNRAGTSSFDSGPSSDGRSRAGSGASEGRRWSGGLVNYSGASELPHSGTGMLQNHGGGGYGGLVNQSTVSDPDEGESSGSVFLRRGGTQGLANRAAAGSDGTRPNAVPRAEEILAELDQRQTSGDVALQKVGQAVEELRHAPETELHSKAGRRAFSACEEHLREIFEEAVSAEDDTEAGKVIWLAGKLAAMEEDDDKEPLQRELRKRLDEMKMSQALERALRLVPRAAKSAEKLEDLMGELDLAEFHALHASTGVEDSIEGVIAELQPQLVQHMKQSLAKGRKEEVETMLATVGGARIQSMGLVKIQEQLQQTRGSELLRGALTPVASQIGFPIIKHRQLRHAMLTARGALAADGSGTMKEVLRRLFKDELFSACVSHSADTALVCMDTAFELGIFNSTEVWTAIRPHYDRLPLDEKQTLSEKLPDRCKRWKKEPPDWLLRPEQAACQSRLRAALDDGDVAELQAACQHAMEIDGGKAVCGKELRAAVDRLRQEYRLPSSWNVEAMLASTEMGMLARTQITDRRVLGLFDKLLKETAHPDVRTRDRRGALPRSFTAVRAVQVMNADIWASYDKRRDEIAREVHRSRARTDDNFWKKNLNGLIEGQDKARSIAELTDAPALREDANEAWLLHGTSHAAAEGITSSDFDMTRASPSGLFGAGVYFAESVSKSDEYVAGKKESWFGEEVFPLLLCRVCLGNVFYCDIRRPDQRQLENKCLRQEWHSVLGDRKKTSGTFREFIVYDNLQAFAAYIVYYTRQY